MAAPHVAGVAALVISAAGRRLAPAHVIAILESSAEPTACPDTNPYTPGGPTPTSGPDAGIPTGECDPEACLATHLAAVCDYLCNCESECIVVTLMRDGCCG